MELKTMTITPEIAKKLLEKNISNRNIRPGVVERYARDMKNGKWTMSNDLIVITDEGYLINGQHRLTAVITAEADVIMNVAFEVDQCDYGNFDGGEKRNLNDNLYFSYGVKLDNTTTADISLFTHSVLGYSKYKKITTAEAYSIYNEYIDYFDRIRNIPKYSKLPAPVRVGCIIGMILYGIDYNRVIEFYEIMLSGFSTSEFNNKAIVARNYMMSPEGRIISGASRIPHTMVYLTCLYEFSKNRVGKRINKNIEHDLTEIKGRILSLINADT